jgi:hypothetical protein
MRSNRFLLLALTLALVAFVVGCGGGQGGGTAALPVLDNLEPVADATGEARSARFETRFTMEMPGLSGFSFSADGAFDAQARKAQVRLDLGSFAEFLGGFAGALGEGAPDELSDPSKWKLELRLDGTVAFLRMPLLDSRLPDGKEWVSIDLDKAAALRGLDLDDDVLSFAKGSDPREALDYLRSVSGGLTSLGTEDVRGVPTTHYFAVLDWQKALARAARESGQAGFLAQIENMPGALANVPVDVWVDADNLVRRMTMDFSFSSPDQPQQEAKASLEMEVFDYGQPVRVDAPAAGDVVDAFSLGG